MGPELAEPQAEGNWRRGCVGQAFVFPLVAAGSEFGSWRAWRGAIVRRDAGGWCAAHTGERAFKAEEGMGFQYRLRVFASVT